MPFHNYKPLKNPVTLNRRYKAGLSEDDEFQVPLSSRLSFWVGMTSGFIDAITLTPLINIVRKQRANEQLNFRGKLKWLFRGRIRQFVMVAPTMTIQSSVVTWGTQSLREYISVNYALKPHEHIRAALFGGLASSLYSSPIEFFRSKQQITRKYLLQISRETIQNFGIIGLYRGWAWTAARDTIFCTGWAGLLPACHVALGNRSPFLKEHQAAVSFPLSFLLGSLCAAPIHAINSAKEVALSYPQDVERSSIRYWLNQMHAEKTLLTGYPVFAVRISLGFYICDRVRWAIWDYHCNRKLRANPRLGMGSIYPYDIGFGVHYSMRDNDIRTFR